MVSRPPTEFGPLITLNVMTNDHVRMLDRSTNTSISGDMGIQGTQEAFESERSYVDLKFRSCFCRKAKNGINPY